MSRPTVGVIGDETARDVVAASSGDPVVGSPAEVAAATPELIVTVGERGLLDAVAAGVNGPMLPVAARECVPSVSRDSLDTALDAFLAGRYETTTRPVISARSPLGETRALMDVMLVTAEPARISEYAVCRGGESVATFRADGVVVATPAGSRGYTRRAGGPVLAPELDVLAVVPVAPFSTDEDTWILPASELELRIERDETPVELLADDRTAGSVVPGESVRVGRDGTLSVAVVDASKRQVK